MQHQQTSQLWLSIWDCLLLPRSTSFRTTRVSIAVAQNARRHDVFLLKKTNAECATYVFLRRDLVPVIIVFVFVHQHLKRGALRRAAPWSLSRQTENENRHAACLLAPTVPPHCCFRIQASPAASNLRAAVSKVASAETSASLVSCASTYYPRRTRRFRGFEM